MPPRLPGELLEVRHVVRDLGLSVLTRHPRRTDARLGLRAALGDRIEMGAVFVVSDLEFDARTACVDGPAKVLSFVDYERLFPCV